MKTSSSLPLLEVLSLATVAFAAAACQNQSPPAAPLDSSTLSAAPLVTPSPTLPSTTAASVDEEPGSVEPGAEGDDPSLPAPPRPAHETGAVGVVAEIDRELSAMRSTTYAHQSRIDEARGEFDYDCSGFVDYALAASAPDAFAEVKQATVGRPLAKHFVSFFSSVPAAGRGHWVSVGHASDLVPGDLIAWLRPPEIVSKNTGHIVFVHGPVSPYQGRSDAFIVPIADSTHAPHGKSDPRTAAHASGLGTGTIVLLTDGAGHPVGYKWSTWKKSVEYRTPIALGRVAR